MRGNIALFEKLNDSGWKKLSRACGECCYSFNHTSSTVILSGCIRDIYVEGKVRPVKAFIELCISDTDIKFRFPHDKPKQFPISVMSGIHNWIIDTLEVLIKNKLILSDDDAILTCPSLECTDHNINLDISNDCLIRSIKRYIDESNIDNYQMGRERLLYEALKKSIRLLEKDESSEVTIKVKDDHKFILCPNCNAPIPDICFGRPYCSKCGQKISYERD